MHTVSIGELEELVLLIVGNLGVEAYGNTIRDEIKNVTQRSLSLSAVHTTLNRLEQKELLSSKYDLGGDTRRRGRPKLIFSLTEQGITVINQIYSTRSKLWKGLQVILSNKP